MKITKLKIENFRGIEKAELYFNGNTVLVGDNNTGKSTVLEAIDLVLGPERLSRYPVIDEHDFYAGKYISPSELEDEDIENPKIKIEVIVNDLNEDQETRFSNNLEWWDSNSKSLLEGPPANATDQDNVKAALRIHFIGYYDEEEDDFFGETYFSSPQLEDETFTKFGRSDKRICGFLFLRTLRTGSRALSLEKGSLLDVILRLQELRPKMWEDILSELRQIPIAENPEIGISPILEKVQKSVRSFVPSEWAVDPHLRVSDLTRVHLRKLLTVFMGTGAMVDDETEYAAPFQHQGTGTINTLVLSLLTMIAELKQNVIFAMEEPEIAIPPHTQKRIVNSVTGKSAQAIFTSHSPYVLEEFDPQNILVVKKTGGELTGSIAKYPPAVKPKKYREEFKRRFCETLLARRVLIAEGRTEYEAFTTAARRLNDLDSDKYTSLEALGIAVINAETDSQIEPLGKFYKDLGKEVFGVFDQQTDESRAAIEAVIDHPYEAPEDKFEKVVLNQTAESGLRKFALSLVEIDEWPPHLTDRTPTEEMSFEDLKETLKRYFNWSKGSGTAADLFSICSIHEIPEYVKSTLEAIKNIVDPKAEDAADLDHDEAQAAE
ncbi:ATP-dependent endonuclease [Roseivirga seohaensis]|uniref:ATP-dependent endonuclease n=1 Tax=Roseivirga seohaensis TaxID=1914963 RepID=A0A150XKW1_9BACT|nr:AAA family ATPase [Roseivirga seohaensis]KYG79378.1 ATP-dependent endonuclease [Roseivirga seohaensis]